MTEESRQDMQLADIDKVLLFKQCKTASIEPNTDTMRLCIDGEIFDAKKVYFEMEPLAVNFVVPKVLEG